MTETSIPIARLVSLFCGLLGVGILLTLPLFKYRVRDFVHSLLFIKIAFWIPIFIVFLTSLYVPDIVKLFMLLALITVSFREAIEMARQKSHVALIMSYFFIIGAALSHFVFLNSTFEAQFIDIMITLCFASVLSDVFAFFMGKYAGKHKLPPVLNPRKSWEGVLGQIVGALAGVGLVYIFISAELSLLTFISIGGGSAAGDLLNSFVKRQLDIKDWSQNIPGHGGFLDRLSSLSLAAAALYYHLLWSSFI